MSAASSRSSSVETQPEVLVGREGHVLTITLNRPERGNSITPHMAEELKKAVSSAETDPDVRVIVLTGRGKFFCTGMDLGAHNQGQMQEALDKGDAAKNSIELFETLKRSSKPLVARINGPSLGGGWGLIFTTDVRVAVKSAYFCFAEVKRGIVPALISAYIVPEIGAFQANQYMLTGMRVPAEQAYQSRFLSALASSEEELDSITKKYVEELLTSAPKAMAHIKSNTRFVTSHPHPENTAYLQQVFARTVRSEEAIYGMSCFLQRQTPDWSSKL